MKRVRVVNETAWRTADLRRFANAAYRRVFMPDEAKLVVVTFHRLRGRHMRGRATVGGWRVWLWLPDGPAAVIQKAALGSILCHELAHNAGVKNERTMRRSRALGWGPGWEQEHAWAEALPLERKPERQLPALTPETRAGHRHVLALAGIQRWQGRLVRAEGMLRLYRQRAKYYAPAGRAGAAKGGGTVKGTVRTRDDCRRALQRLMGPGSEVQTHYDWLEGSKMCLVTTPGGRRYAGRGLTWQRAFEQVREQVVREFERRAGEEAAAG